MGIGARRASSLVRKIRTSGTGCWKLLEQGTPTLQTVIAGWNGSTRIASACGYGATCSPVRSRTMGYRERPIVWAIAASSSSATKRMRRSPARSPSITGWAWTSTAPGTFTSGSSIRNLRPGRARSGWALVEPGAGKDHAAAGTASGHSLARSSASRSARRNSGPEGVPDFGGSDCTNRARGLLAGDAASGPEQHALVLITRGARSVAKRSRRL